MYIVVIIIVFVALVKNMRRRSTVEGQLSDNQRSSTMPKMPPSLALAKLGMTAAGVLQWCNMDNIYDLLKDRCEGLDR